MIGSSGGKQGKQVPTRAGFRSGICKRKAVATVDISKTKASIGKYTGAPCRERTLRRSCRA